MQLLRKGVTFYLVLPQASDRKRDRVPLHAHPHPANFVCISVALHHTLAWQSHFANASQQELLSAQHFGRTVCLLEKLNADVEALPQL